MKFIFRIFFINLPELATVASEQRLSDAQTAKHGAFKLILYTNTNVNLGICLKV